MAAEKEKNQNARTLGEIAEPLLEWYSKNARMLPWRESPEPYRVWISEIMLQQTRVEAVKPYYERFLSALPSIAALAEAPEEQLLKLWEGLGYYSRVRNLQKAAQKVMQEYGGALPASYEQLKSLPGIGEYTAGAIASIAFGIAVPVVDGNVLRVISRITGSFEQIDTAACKKRIWRDLEQSMPKTAPGDFNQALMELGATVCLPNGAPLCARCPLAEKCAALANGWIQQIPVRAPKKQKKVEHYTVLLLWQDGKIALQRRKQKGLLAGMWQFPSLEGEMGQEKVRQELERQGTRVLEIRPAGQAQHIFTHIIWKMNGFCVCLEQPLSWEGLQFWEPQELLEKVALPSAFRHYTALVRQAAEKEREE